MNLDDHVALGQGSADAILELGGLVAGRPAAQAAVNLDPGPQKQV